MKISRAASFLLLLMERNCADAFLPSQRPLSHQPFTRASPTWPSLNIDSAALPETALLSSSLSSESPDATAAPLAEFPPPLTATQRTRRAIEFYKRVLPVLAAYKAKEIELKFKKLSKEEEEKVWADLDEWGSTVISDTIQDMKGFYVKTGQVIGTRVDLFPEAYTSKLQELQDGLEPMPFEMVESVVRQELLDGAPLSELFSSFEKEPLGAASIAQVHKATLLDGRTVAVKLQRPNVEPKLLGDVANLKRISKALADSLPVDYYTVFCELGDALERELDFLSEAQAMRKLQLAISDDAVADGNSRPPVKVPLPIGELVSKRVLVMDFVEGVPLNRVGERMKERGIEPGSPESKIAGRRIIESLAEAFARMTFGAGFVHSDPHPGNIFIGEGGKVSLIDCGQFKALSRTQRAQFAELVLAVAEYQETDPSDIFYAKIKLANLVREFGVTFRDGKENDDDLAASVALLLFGNADQEMPGGYSTNELSDMSPVKQVASFPQELVLQCRATVLLKGIAKKLDVPFSLANVWRESCQLALETSSKPAMPIWGKDNSENAGATETTTADEDKIKFRQVVKLLKMWGRGKAQRFIERVIKKLPPDARSKVLAKVIERQERKQALKMEGKK